MNLKTVTITDVLAIGVHLGFDEDQWIGGWVRDDQRCRHCLERGPSSRFGIAIDADTCATYFGHCPWCRDENCGCSEYVRGLYLEKQDYCAARFLSFTEAAPLLGVHPRTLYRRRAAGKLHGLVGRGLIDSEIVFERRAVAA